MQRMDRVPRGRRACPTGQGEAAGQARASAPPAPAPEHENIASFLAYSKFVYGSGHIKTAGRV